MEDKDAINKADFVVLIRTVNLEVFCVVLMFHSVLAFIIASAYWYDLPPTNSSVVVNRLSSLPMIACIAFAAK